MDLKQAGINKRQKRGCRCNKTYMTLVYKLPIKLDADIVPYISVLGTPAVPFNNASVLKIETKKYSISGIKRLKEVKFILKKGMDEPSLQAFEAGLIEYVNSKK